MSEPPAQSTRNTGRPLPGRRIARTNPGSPTDARNGVGYPPN